MLDARASVVGFGCSLNGIMFLARTGVLVAIIAPGHELVALATLLFNQAACHYT
jgi:hypothetical protein